MYACEYYEVERQRHNKQSTTPRTAQRKEELLWVEFEPTTLCSLGSKIPFTWIWKQHIGGFQHIEDEQEGDRTIDACKV